MVEVGQRQKPSWCFAVRITPVIPAAAQAATHWSASTFLGLNRSADSVPSPHSASVMVFIPKCRKP